MSLQIIRNYETYEADILVESNEISDDSLFQNPEFILFCVETDIDEDTTLDDVITQFNSK